MHDHAPILDGRVERWLNERIRPAETTRIGGLQVSVAHLTDAEGSAALGATPGVIGQGEPITFAEAMQRPFEDFSVGAEWGPAWGTTWMRFRGQVEPEHQAADLECFIDLGGTYDAPGFQCEGLVFRPDGSIIKGHNPKNKWVPVEPDGQGRFEFFLEAAANPVVLGFPPWAETELGSKPTAGSEPLYRLVAADLVRINGAVRELIADIVTLRELAGELPENSERRWEIRRGLDRALDRIVLADVPGSAAAAREELAPLLARPAAASAHSLVAVGHAHIDSAWLWPLRETRRKVARTIANQLNLLQAHPEHRFAFPAAQHAAWLQADHPELFERLRAAVAADRIIPVGGMWVESDANLPSGEAMARQFVYGQQFFQREFGHRCEEVWLPDSFGYSGALPQLAKLAGARWFLTQKISWNQVNDFPHHSFWWEGIDGTRIFTHFPPADTYCSDLAGSNLAHAARNFRDKGRSDVSLVPFGWGDGGGGPTREMLGQARRVADLDGSPRMEIATPAEFFERAEAVHESPSVWVGELYLELHRGTFTSVAAVKRGNRRNEALLREAELWCATAAVRGLMAYPLERLGELWREVCLYQFHDILPGTCIAWVYDEVLARHESISAELRTLIEQAQAGLAGDGDDQISFNASPLAVNGVPPLAAGPAKPASDPVAATRDGEAFVLDNGLTRVRITDGLVTSLVDLASGRESIPPGEAGAVLHLHPDFPNQWDAWDIDSTAFNTHSVLVPTGSSLEATQTEAGVRVSYAFGGSSGELGLSLRAGDPRLYLDLQFDWQERDSLLKLAWPVDVHTDSATSEIEFGHLRRPTHTNTSWDAQRFETHAHRWIHVGEDDFGVAIANAQTYGWDVTRHAREGGGTWSQVRASLLKGARFPDPRTDIGQQDFRFTIRPAAGIAEAVSDGYELNLPKQERRGTAVPPLVELNGPVLVEAIKLAEDGSGDVIVRLYEPYGRRAEATLAPSFEASSILETDLHEEELVAGSPHQRVAPTAIVAQAGNRVSLQLRPFQVASLRLGRQ